MTFTSLKLTLPVPSWKKLMFLEVSYHDLLNCQFVVSISFSQQVLNFLPYPGSKSKSPIGMYLHNGIVNDNGQL